MGFDIKKLIGKIGKTSQPFDTAFQQFLSPDLNAIDDDLRLTKRARESGKDNFPKSDAGGKDSFALEIDTYLRALVRKAKNELENHLDGLVGLDIYQNTESYANDIRDRTKAGLNSLRENCRNGVNDLFPQRRKVADGELALEKFRKRNHLERPAVFPHERSRLLGVVFFLFTLEVALNTYTLGSAHPEGVGGVLLETFMIAALNVGIGFTTGWLCWREIIHRRVARRVFGLAMSAFLLCLILAGNLAVGHYRDAILSTSSRALELGTMGFIAEMAMLGAAVGESLLTHTLALHDFKSYLTIFVGIGLALYAAKEGFSSDDPYPGYGPRIRAQDARTSVYAKLFADRQAELIKIDKSATEEINAIGKLGAEALAAKHDHTATANRLISSFMDWTKELEAIGAALYARYREANEQSRSDGRPPCFDIEFSLPTDLVTAPGYAGSLQDDVATPIDPLIDTCSKKMDLALNKYIGVYKTIGALAPEDLTREYATSFDEEVEKIYEVLSSAVDNANYNDNGKVDE